MKRAIQGFLVLLLYSGNVAGFGQKSLYGIRSQAVNAAVELAGWQALINKDDQKRAYFTFAVTPEYTHTFREGRINRFLFGQKQLIFSGSLNSNRDPQKDILADYFGLPSDFRSSVCFHPQIINFIMDFDLFVGLDNWAPGLYTRIHAPIVQAKWDLNLKECVYDPGTTYTSYPAGYLAATSLTLADLTTAPHAPKNVRTALQGTTTFGDMREPLQYGKVFGRQTDVRISELWMVVGYNFLLSDWYHAGFNLRTAAPTGTLRRGEFLFEPIVGNDHHWEFGGGFTGHVKFWSDNSNRRMVGLYVDCNATHLFASTQKRSFDLTANGPGSRYMLLQTIASPSAGLDINVAPYNVTAPNQYQGRIEPVINKTTLDTKVAVAAQVDMVAKLAYQHRGFEFDFGYNLWYRSAETCKWRACIEECYGLKGDAQLYGFTNPAESVVALNATQSKATLYHGQDINEYDAFVDQGNFVEGMELANFNADNKIEASNNLGAFLYNLTFADAATFGFTRQSVMTSNPAILIKNSDLNNCSALLPRAISHKFFFYIGYHRDVDLGVIPYVGVGGSGEWGASNTKTNSAPSQWSVWLKGGVSY
jgi:hypothetical protein